MKHCPNPDCRGRVRDGRVAEFADTIESCLDCDARLVPGPALPDAEEPALEFHALETVFVSTGRVTARVVAGLLEASGIPVYVKGEMLAGAIGELPATVEPRAADGEVEAFYLWSIDEVLTALRGDADFKFNVGPAILASFLERGLLDDDPEHDALAAWFAGRM